jgi:hypothetical protein
MRDLDRHGNAKASNASNASIEWANREAAKQAVQVPDNATVRGDGKLVKVRENFGELRKVAPGHSNK